MKVVITGSSSGIGKKIAHFLESKGHQVWGLSRRNCPEISKWTKCDVSDWHQVNEAMKTIESAWGHVDALICCAGTQGAIGKSMDIDPLEWSQTIKNNLDSTYFVIRGLFNLLNVNQSRGKILCFSGGGATSPRPYLSAYGSAKTAIVRLVETLAEEWKNLPIDINAIAPGAMHTSMTDEILRLGSGVVGEEEYKSACKVAETGGASTEKLFSLIEYLLSPQSDGVRGMLIAAQWDPWLSLKNEPSADLYKLRRIT